MKKSILITGCSTGIGLHTAQRLKTLGYQVFATARAPQDVAKLAAMGLMSHRLDLTEPDTIEVALQWVLAKTGGTLFALFNNGAYGQPGAVEDLPTDALRQQFETNVFGWHELTKRVIPIMRMQGEGRIIQNSSVLGFVTMPYRGAYNASKYAIEGLTDTLRLELSDTNIFISLIEPGPIDTQFRANALAMFKQNIVVEGSVHQSAYQEQITRLAEKDTSNRFTLPAEAVTKKVIKCLTAPQPKPRYFVTFPTHLFATLKRILPTRWLDALLKKG